MRARPEDLDELLTLEEDLARVRSRQGLLSFSMATMPDFIVSWHHRAICRLINYLEMRRTPRELLASWGIEGKELARQVQRPHAVTGLFAGMTHPDMIDRPLGNVQIWVPPQYGKSEIVSRRAPAWMLGRDPDRKIVSTSYSADLSRLNGRAVSLILEGSAYRAIFPETMLAGTAIAQGVIKRGSYVKNADLFEVVGHRGVYKNAGVGGSLTGFSSDVAIVDDPLRNRDDAESPKKRETLWRWFQSVLYTRASRDPARIIINTRWHQRDLSGATLAAAQSDPLASQWFCLVLPAVLDCDPGPGDPRTKDGEVLWEHKANAQQMREIQQTLSAYEFASLYQQRPAPPEGGIVKLAWFNYWHVLPPGLTHWTISADLTFKERGDFMVLQVWASKGADHYLIDQVRDRLPFTGQLRAFRTLCAKYPQVRVKLVEDAANGAALVDTVRREIAGVIGVRPEGSKSIRLDAVSPLIEAGNVYLPAPDKRRWVQDLLEEVVNFPMDAHDDMVDAMSLYLARTQRRVNYASGGIPIELGKLTHRDHGPAMGE